MLWLSKQLWYSRGRYLRIVCMLLHFTLFKQQSIHALLFEIRNKIIHTLLNIIFYWFEIQITYQGLPWSWSYGSWIYNYLCNQCLSPLTLWVRIPLRRGVLDTTLCDKVCQWLAVGRWFSTGFIHQKTDSDELTEILLKVALNSINHNQITYLTKHTWLIRMIYHKWLITND